MSTAPTVLVGHNIRAELARRKKSQNTLAIHLNVSQSWVSARLNGRTPFDINELDAIAKFLDVPLSTFLPDSTSAA